ncbi:Retrovirus-related Pol polyprotein from transposon RE1 [Vitis vinifera]|uniref:Retrovirus-related Pol polyprotein from transposon RE1 n=1 Tax=Vitis vinifera TaxID=29760 RepID=A0A438JWJ4_VITVI|nr:Retrovirus-related Pol polyprotein from transposon RE1 [Vitis vinifera]
MVVRQRSTQNWQDQSKTNHPKTCPNINKSIFKCTHCNKTGHTKSRCFEIVGYPDWWDHNHDQQKKYSKKTSIVVVVEIKTKTGFTENASALIATTNYDDHMTFDSRQVSPLNLPHKKLFPQPMSKDSNKLRQALMVNGSEGEKKSLKFGCGIDVWDMLPLGKYHKEIQTFDYDYHIFKEDESGQSELVNQEVGEPSSNDHLEVEEVIKEGKDSTIEPSEQFGSEDAFTEILNQSSSTEDFYSYSVQEALANPRWKAAMNEKMKSLQKNETWELVECPGKKPVGCRWIYIVKYKADGSIEHFKARLVAKGTLNLWN